jgi:hypothetical protein
VLFIDWLQNLPTVADTFRTTEADLREARAAAGN